MTDDHSFWRARRAAAIYRHRAMIARLRKGFGPAARADLLDAAAGARWYVAMCNRKIKESGRA